MIQLLKYFCSFLVILIPLQGCSTIKVIPGKSAQELNPYQDSLAFNLEVSPRTELTLRQLNLKDLLEDHPERACDRLHEMAQKDPRPDYLFALAEIRYIKGRKAELFHRDTAIAEYYLCAGYAYHYLFATANRKLEQTDRIDPSSRQDLTPRNAFDPRFRLACELYNRSLSRCISAGQKMGHLDPTSSLVIGSPDGSSHIDLAIVQHGFTWKREEFGDFLFCDDLTIEGIDNHHETYGLGVPLIVRRNNIANGAVGGRYPRKISFPATALVRFDGDLDLLYTRQTAKLELFNPLDIRKVDLDGLSVPLQTDLTTPLAYLLSGTDLELAGYFGFIQPQRLEKEEGIYMLEPYQPGKIPVILVHGLLSSPLTWTPLYNELQSDPRLRDKYQFWFYFYPTANPYLLSASGLRKSLKDLRNRLDPDGSDDSFENMVLVGHSMGGIISRLMTVDSKDDFWQQLNTKPIDDVRGTPEEIEDLRQVYYFRRNQNIKRVVYIATPHHGSRVSPSIPGQLAKSMISEPRMLLDTFSLLQKEGIMRKGASIPTSVDQLAPDSPILQLVSSKPKPAGVKYHSIIGMIDSKKDWLSRSIAGTIDEEGDGVVSYQSAHLDEASSEKIVRADHVKVHQHPLAILEVKRILMEHLKTTGNGLIPSNGKDEPVLLPVLNKAVQP